MDHHNGPKLWPNLPFPFSLTLLKSTAVSMIWSKGKRRVDLENAAKELKLRPQTIETLKWLKDRACRVAILSDANEFWIKQVCTTLIVNHPKFELY